MNLPTMANPIIALTGPTGSGKDTIGQYLVDHHNYTRVSFGDFLRIDTEQQYNITRPKNERMEKYILLSDITSPGQILPKHSFKDLMIKTGAKMILQQPTRYIDLVLHEIASIEGPIVVTDMRRLLEYESIRLINTHLFWAFRVHRDVNPYQPKCRDSLLDAVPMPKLHNHHSPDADGIDTAMEQVMSDIIDHLYQELPANYDRIFN